VDEYQLIIWKNKILKEDPDTEFDKKKPFSVCHSKCGDIVKIKEPYNSTHFCDHSKNCTKESRKRRPAAGMPSLASSAGRKGDCQYQ